MKEITFLTALCCFTFLLNAQNSENQTSSQIEMAPAEETRREFVANQDGIDVYFSTSDLSGNVLLNIHYTNTTAITKTFNWVISKADSKFSGRNVISLKAGESFDQNAIAEVKGTTNLADYSIQLIFK